MPLTSEMVCGHPMYRGEHGGCTCPKCDPLRYSSAEGYAEHMQRLGQEIGAAIGVPRRFLGRDQESR